MNDFLRSYLQDRWQFVSATNLISSKMKIETVVSQGSTLGPFHILLIVNDLYLAIEDSKIVMFADEATIVNSGKSSNPLVGNDLKNITDWFHCNELTENVEKCGAIAFGACKPTNSQFLINEFCMSDLANIFGITFRQFEV